MIRVKLKYAFSSEIIVLSQENNVTKLEIKQHSNQNGPRFGRLKEMKLIILEERREREDLIAII